VRFAAAPDDRAVADINGDDNDAVDADRGGEM
jgi:hypothetical protein